MKDYKKENVLILQLCRFLDYDREVIIRLLMDRIDYSYVLGSLMLNRTGGIAYTVLKDAGLLDYVSREFRSSLETCREMNVIKTRSYKKALNEIAGILGKSCLDYALLKGAYLAFLYPEGCRTSNDIDILIKQSDIDTIGRMLYLNEFTQGYISNGEIVAASRKEILSARMNRGETVPFIKKIYLQGMENLEMDINFSLDFKAKQETDAVKDFIDNSAEVIRTENGVLRTLSEEDFLIHLCMHLFKEAATYNWVVMGRDLSLYKFCDIYMWLYQFMDEKLMTMFIQRVRKYGLEKECYYALYNTRELFDMNDCYLDNIIESIKLSDLSFMKEIYNPENKKTLEYGMNFTDWMFCGNRMEALCER